MSRFSVSSWVYGAIMALALVLWFLTAPSTASSSDITNNSSSSGVATTDKQISAVRVKAKRSQISQVMETVTLSGRTAALKAVELQLRTGGVVESLPFDAGERVNQGDVLVRLAAEDQQSILDYSSALVAQRKAEYNAQRKLSRQGFQATLQIAQAKANYEAAKRELLRAELNKSHLTVKAPFAGVLESRPIEIGEVVTAGTSAGRLVQEDQYLVYSDAIERDARRIKPNQVAHIRFSDGSTTPSLVKRVGIVADAGTSTYRVELSVNSHGERFMAGASVDVTIELGERAVHRLSADVLTLDDENRIGVYTVAQSSINEDGVRRAKFVPVNIMDSDSSAVYVNGLPKEAIVVTVGQAFIVEDSHIQVVLED